ncbi:DUF4157 domain-containing protein [Candidatus Nitrososphaera evergladensis]|nr:DUF4157 domain-containing protein [Candidatus Nitrososphaera evergladensis]
MVQRFSVNGFDFAKTGIFEPDLHGPGKSPENVQEDSSQKAIARTSDSILDSDTAKNAPPIVQGVLRSPGRSLDPHALEFFGSRLGHDFRNVRLHDDEAASYSASIFGAKAYTFGNHVVFNKGRNNQSTEGLQLFTHELAHVVQQDMGKGTGLQASTPQAEDEAREISALDQAESATVKVAAGTGMAFSLEDWQNSTPDVSTRSYTELIEDIDQISQWLDRQTTSSFESTHLEEVLVQLRGEVARRDAAARGRSPRRPRGRTRAAKSGTAAPANEAMQMPRVLAERSSFAYENSDEMRREVDLIMAWLQRSDVSRSDRQILQIELGNLAPQLHQDRIQRAMARRAETIQRALAPPADMQDARARTLESVRRIDGIARRPDGPGFVLMQGSEMIVLDESEVTRLRASVVEALDRAVTRARDMNEYTYSRGQAHLQLNYEEHPYVGFAVSVVSGEEPAELWNRVLDPIQNSNIAATGYRSMGDSVSLTSRAERALYAIEEADRARRLLNQGIERAESSAERIVTGLEITRDVAFTIALSLGAIAAAPVVAAGAAGAGLSGATAFGVTTVGTGAVVGLEGAGLGMVGGMAQEAAAGGSLSDVLASGGREARRWAKRGAVIGVSAGPTQAFRAVLGAGTPGLSTASNLVRSTAAEMGGNAIVGMGETALEGGSAKDILKSGGIGAASGLISGPLGAVTSRISSPTARTLAGMAVGGGTGYLGASIFSDDPNQAWQSAIIGATVSGVSSSHAGSAEMTPGQQRAYEIGRGVRRQARVMVGRARNVLAAAMIGTADAFPPARITGSLPSIIGRDDIALSLRNPALSEPVEAIPAARTGNSSAPDIETTPSSTQEAAPGQPASDVGPASPSQPARTTPGRVSGPEVFEELSRELGLTPPGASQRGAGSAAADALAGGLIGAQGAPGTVDIAFQSHGSATEVRNAYGVTGQQQQSAHVGPTSFLRDVPTYSRRRALTTLLDPATHRAFDDHWKNWAIRQRRAGRVNCTVGEMRQVMFDAIEQIPNMPQRTRNVLRWRMELELNELGLGLGDSIDLPYANISPTSTQ